MQQRVEVCSVQQRVVVYSVQCVCCPQGDMVYVNYGRTEDFFKLEREMGINCTGKIVIARYGKIFRGNKVRKLQHTS